tara:strand:- start:21147 stop:21497 length:351 start_codon:yes stop_codon:yes gene_type:complete
MTKDDPNLDDFWDKLRAEKAKREPISMEEAGRRMKEGGENPLSKREIRRIVKKITGQPQNKVLKTLDLLLVPTSITRHVSRRIEHDSYDPIGRTLYDLSALSIEAAGGIIYLGLAA